jgi:hypothetical protein
MKKIIIFPLLLLISCQAILRTTMGVKKMIPKTLEEIRDFTKQKNIPLEDVLLLKIQMKEFFEEKDGKKTTSSDLDYQLYDKKGTPIAEYLEGCMPVNLEYGNIDKMKIQEDKRYTNLSKVFEKVESFDKKIFDFEKLTQENDFILVIDWATWAYKISKGNINDAQKFIKNNPKYKIKVLYLNLDLKEYKQI